MDDSTHTDRPGNLPEDYQEVPTPDPHAGEPAPRPEEGLRPEADPDVVRPEQVEENGPLPGLIAASAAEVESEADSLTPGDDDPEAEALLASMGVEDEGIEAGQLLGLVAATVVSVAALAIVLIYLFYIPYKTQVDLRAEDAVVYEDLRAVQAAGLAKITDYGRDGDAYTLPIERAMGLVAAEYEAAGDYNEAAGALPTTAAGWNTLMVVRGPGRAIVAPPTPPVPDVDVTPPAAVEADPEMVGEGEEVGVDEPFEDDE